MSVSHGDLFGEIGELVLAAQGGRQIDITAKSEDLARRYRRLNVSEEVIAKAITRAIGAISFSMARVSLGKNGEAGANGHDQNGYDAPATDGDDAAELPALPKSIFPSGVKLAVLS
jgi:hypothetical protein